MPSPDHQRTSLGQSRRRGRCRQLFSAANGVGGAITDSGINNCKVMFATSRASTNLGTLRFI
jgi:hypothetical protein